MIFGSLDFVYIPSKDVDTDLEYYVTTLGAEKIFNISDLGTQVAMMKLGDGPRLLLAGHLKGEVPILIYRVENLKKAMKELKARGWKKGQEVEKYRMDPAARLKPVAASALRSMSWCDLRPISS